MPLEDTVKALQAHLAELSKHMETISDVESGMIKAKSKLGDLQAEVERMEGQKAKVAKEIKELQQQLTALRAEKIKEREDRSKILAEARQRLKEVEESIANGRTQHARLEADINTLKSKFA